MSPGNTNDSLSPGDSSASERPFSALSSASSLGGLYDSYLTSPRASTSSVALAGADADFRHPSIGITSAHRRNSSPVPARSISSEDEGGGGLHRRSPSRIHARDGSGSYAPPAEEGAGGEVGWRHGGGAGDARRAAGLGGWGGYRTPSPTSPSAGTGENRGRGRGSDTTFVRPLPRSPGEQLRGDGVSLSAPPRDPLQSNYQRHSHILSNYSISSSHSLSRVDSHPFSLAPSSHDASDDEDDQARRTLASTPLNRIPSHDSDDPHTPLQPNFVPPVRSASFQIPRPQFLGSNSPSPSPRLASAESNRRTSQAYPTGNALGRRTTLSAAARGLRRISLRVVNLAGAGPEVLVREQPSERKHPHRRMSDQEDGVVEQEGGEDEEDERDAPDLDDLRGKTLGIFGPKNWFRIGCARALRWRWTEPLILLSILLSVVILTIQSAPSVYDHPRPSSGYFHTWEDYALFALFALFTVEILARIVVTGLVINPFQSPSPSTASTTTPSGTFKNAGSTSHSGLSSSLRSPLASPSKGYPPLPADSKPYERGYASFLALASSTSLSPGTPLHSRTQTTSAPTPGKPSVFSLRPALSSSIQANSAAPFVLSIRKQRSMNQRAFLRHSWNRVDLVAVASFWVCFALAMVGVEARYNLFIFRALSVLRATRLLAVTAGTMTILQSLKKASPQLVQVAFFVTFAMTLFSIVGVQAFQGSFRRACQWTDPTGVFENVTFDQRCGGFIDSVTGNATGYIVSATGLPTNEAAKGFICPSPSICIEDENPSNGLMSFDNIFAALLQVVIVTSANTWTGVMFNMMDADFFVSCLFFIVGIIVLNFWLVNLFVSVITSSFASITDETKHSAFASASVAPNIGALGEPSSSTPQGLDRGTSLVRQAYKRTRLFWVAAIVADLGIQASRNADMPASKLASLLRLELYFTIAFDVEIILRAIASLPDWRSLWSGGQNITDITLAVVTSVIQIPIIRDSNAYPWLTFFQLARFYRVILAIPRTRRLLVRVTGTFSALINMIFFLLAMNFISALIGVQLLRGVVQPDEDGETPAMSYLHIYNAFLAQYQLLSSENWTDIVDSVLSSEIGQLQTVLAAVFMCGWMLFGYFILINMFVALLNENFAIAEAEKHKQQLQAFVDRSEPQAATESWFRRFNLYNYVKAQPKTVSVGNIPSNLVLPMKKSVVRDYMTEGTDEKKVEPASSRSPINIFSKARNAIRMSRTPENVALEEIASPVDSYGPVYQGDLLPATDSSAQDQEHSRGIIGERRALQTDFIVAHLSYDRSLWIFSQKNAVRRFCQRLVDPAYGNERICGRPAVAKERLAFQIAILLAILGSVVVASIATPVYRRDYFLEHGTVRWTWFNLTEISLGLVFIGEFFVKVIADGFLFAPNAYLLSIWNDLDFFVLITIVANVTTALISGTGISRFTRSLKAFRALRLINLTATMRETFYNVLIVGAGRIMDASMLAILYIVPWAVYGQNVFSGLLFFCNDSSVATKAECAGEFLNAAVSDWAYLTPRIWSNPYVWSFDSFKSALLILFEVISLEGWTAVRNSSMDIVGLDLQPRQGASQYNALFFVAYNLVGAVFILTIFISVIIENFTRRSGMSLLTTEQRQFLDLRKIIARQQPPKRPKRRPELALRSWCYDRAIEKQGWWSRLLTALYLTHVVLLMTQASTNPPWVNTARNFVFLALTLFYLVDVFVRVAGLGWSYAQNGWNLYDVFVVSGTFATTIPILLGTQNEVAVQLQKLFLVAIAFKLVQKNDSLNQLFKTAAASVPNVLNILGLWFILFLVWAIFYTEVFALTRWGPNGTRTANYAAFVNALVMLALASTGEGWNGFMHDYTVQAPLCTESSNFLFSDCGSSGWAFSLFISWNVLSQYLLTNLILGAVVENFSFVFQVYGRVKSLNREQLRSFKKVWAEFDTERSGYLPRRDLVRFLGRLTGVFEVKIFRDEWSIPKLLEAATDQSATDSKNVHVDVAKLARAIQAIDLVEVRRRKHLYNRLYHEAMMDAEGRGISFRNMLLLLAHYRLIEDDKALRLEEMIARREKMEKVMDRVNSDSVRGLLTTIILRRKFLAHREAVRQSELGLPAIVVEEEERPGLSIDTSGIRSSSPRTPPDSPSGRSPSRSPFALSPGSDGEDSFDRRSMSMSPSPSQRQSISAEDGDVAVAQMVGRWGGAFADDDDDDDL